MDTATSKDAPFHHWREVYQAIRGQSSVLNRLEFKVDVSPKVPSRTNSVQPLFTNSSAATPVDPKRPYGGLVPSVPKGTRAYESAAAYNQQLLHHQAIAAATNAAVQASYATQRNPYVNPPTTQQASASRYPQVREEPHVETQYSPMTQAAPQSAGGSNQNDAGGLSYHFIIAHVLNVKQVYQSPTTCNLTLHRTPTIRLTEAVQTPSTAWTECPLL